MTDIERLEEKIGDLTRMVTVMSNLITYNTAESAMYLSCSTNTIRNMVNAGVLVPLGAGGDWRFRKCDLDANELETRTAKARSIAAGLASRRKAKSYQ